MLRAFDGRDQRDECALQPLTVDPDRMPGYSRETGSLDGLAPHKTVILEQVRSTKNAFEWPQEVADSSGKHYGWQIQLHGHWTFRDVCGTRLLMDEFCILNYIKLPS